ncbi:MAG: hypothetical protein JWL94_1859, partial [Microbacteriaceae bacterium]|nr:hypothetical protein [Microbacteriaceae bacterium]
TNFLSALQEDERRVKHIESALSSTLLQLSSLKLKRHSSLLHPVSTAGEVDALLKAVGTAVGLVDS